MKKITNIVKNIALLSFLVGALVVSAIPALANNDRESRFINANASLKADALVKFESSTGVMIGPNGKVRVMGAKVTSVANNEIKATTLFGNSSLNFTIKVSEDTKLNGKTKGSANSSIDLLKAGDRINFSGVMSASTSSSIAVDSDHIVSRVFVDNSVSDNDDKDDDNDDRNNEDNKKDKDDKKDNRGWFGKALRWFWK